MSNTDDIQLIAAQASIKESSILDILKASSAATRRSLMEKTEGLHKAEQANDSREADSSVTEDISYQPIVELGKVAAGNGSYLESIGAALKTMAGVSVKSAEEIEGEAKGLMEEPDNQAPLALNDELTRTEEILRRGNELTSSASNLATGNIAIVSNNSLRMGSSSFLSLETNGTLFSHSPIRRELGQVHTTDYYSSQRRAQIGVDRVEHLYETGDTRITRNNNNTTISTNRNSTVARNASRTASEETLDTSNVYGNQSTRHRVIARESISQSSRGDFLQQAGQEHTLMVGQPTANQSGAFFSIPSLSSPPESFIQRIVGGAVSRFSNSEREVTGDSFRNVLEDARDVVMGDTASVGNRMATLTKGIRVDGVGNGVVSLITQRGKFNLKGWAASFLPSIIEEVTNCIEIPKLPAFPDIKVPFDISLINCQGRDSEDTLFGVAGDPPPDTLSGTAEIADLQSQVREGAAAPQDLLQPVTQQGGDNPIPAGISSNTTTANGGKKEDESSALSKEQRRLSKASGAIIASGSFNHPTGVYIDRWSYPETVRPEDEISWKMNRPVQLTVDEKGAADTLSSSTVEGAAAADTITSSSSAPSISGGAATDLLGRSIQDLLGTDFPTNLPPDGVVVGMEGENVEALTDFLKGEAVPETIINTLSEVAGDSRFFSIGREMGLSLGVLEGALTAYRQEEDSYKEIFNVIDLLPEEIEGFIEEKIDEATGLIEKVQSFLDPDYLLKEVQSLIGDIPLLDEIDKVLSIFGISSQEGLANLFKDLTSCLDKWVQFDDLLNKDFLKDLNIDIDLPIGRDIKDLLDRLPEGITQEFLDAIKDGIDIEEIVSLASRLLDDLSIDIDIFKDWSLCKRGPEEIDEGEITEGIITDVIEGGNNA